MDGLLHQRIPLFEIFHQHLQARKRDPQVLRKLLRIRKLSCEDLLLLRLFFRFLFLWLLLFRLFLLFLHLLL